MANAIEGFRGHRADDRQDDGSRVIFANLRAEAVGEREVPMRERSSQPDRLDEQLTRTRALATNAARPGVWADQSPARWR